jgi:tripartite-type tricarboxylate transporter receptor subunit TctC
MSRIAAALLCAIIAAFSAQSGRAEGGNYPSHPIRIIVPYPAGGLVDLVTRVVTERLSAKLGQQFVVESRPGANGTIATAFVAHAEPDGYTLLMITDSHGVNPLFYRSLSYDSVAGFAPVGLIGKSPMVLTVHHSVPAQTGRSLSTMRAPILGSCRTARSASGAPAISPGSCSRCAPASICCTSPTAAAHRR